MKVIYLRTGPMHNYRKAVEDDVFAARFMEAPDIVYEEVPGEFVGGEQVFEPTEKPKGKVADKTKLSERPITDLLIDPKRKFWDKT